ncbi:MAG: glycerol-3-phosphate dehydrogenase [Pararhodobacter sp.]|nr:glycerol-3-phosphate dehydrogenase [Pararhodobacter sp.]
MQHNYAASILLGHSFGKAQKRIYFQKTNRASTNTTESRKVSSHLPSSVIDAPPGPDLADLLIIGGGVNGCGIARDAAGRGLTVVLAEKDDLAAATSSASTKLFHGGLRYLEYFEFRLVREALREREVLLRNMPHIAWPMRFVLPRHDAMRFDSDTPMSRVLGRVMPWMRGRRPGWLIRAGLFLYDHMGARKLLPATATLHLHGSPEGEPLKPEFEKAFEYSDCWVDDARLVVLNARDAAARGARILTRTRVISARSENGIWHVEAEGAGKTQIIRARMIVNAAGPWAGAVLQGALGLLSPARLRLVRGSHIVTNRLFDHDKAYFLQGSDGRIVFALPYERDFTLIGTTDAAHDSPDTPARCTEAERDYLCDFVSRYFRQPVRAADVVWSFAGVRPLYDDGARSDTAATRDYVLKLNRSTGAPVLHVFGGKITTYRRLAEAALAQIATALPLKGGPWTAAAPLPGGDFAPDGAAALVADLRARHEFLGEAWAWRLVRAYGTEARAILGDASQAEDLGQDFGATLREAELRWLVEREFARSGEDVLWRRSKLGLRMDEARRKAVAAAVSALVARLEEGAAHPG